jgi:hypothetical protein
MEESISAIFIIEYEKNIPVPMDPMTPPEERLHNWLPVRDRTLVDPGHHSLFHNLLPEV